MTKRFFIGVFMVIAVTALVFAGGNQEDRSPADGGKLQIVTTTSMITDVVKNIAGDHADVVGLIPRGQDPHGYEPNPRQIGSVEKAQIVFVNGLELEEQILEIVEKTAGGKLVEVSDGIVAIRHDDHDDHDHDAEHEDHDDHDHDAEYEHHHAIDPHTWMSPRNVKVWVSNIEKTLSAADPANSADYAAAAKAYTEKLDALDKETSEKFSGIPEGDKLIITDHEVFGYLARDYGFTVIGAILPSLSTNSEASAKHLAELVEIIRDNNINAVFVGVSSSEAVNKLAAALSEESGRNVKILSILTGSLAAEGARGDTYLDFFRYNAEQILKGLKN